MTATFSERDELAVLVRDCLWDSQGYDATNEITDEIVAAGWEPMRDRARQERDEALAEIALMRPVVDAATDYVRLCDSFGLFARAHLALKEATRTYMEGTK